MSPFFICTNGRIQPLACDTFFVRLVPTSDGRLKIGIRVVSRIEVLLLNKHELVDTIDLTDSVDCRRATESEANMRRMDKEFEKRGITWESDEMDIIMKGLEYDSCQKLVDITEDYIITVFYSAVLDPELMLYDRRTFEPIAVQNLYPEMSFSGSRTWGSAVYDRD